MKTYSVKEIAVMLHTDPETVRRWIRNGKLKAYKQSNKEGMIVDENMLEAFLKDTPKYAAVAVTAVTAATAASVAAGSLASAAIPLILNLVMDKYQTKRDLDKARIRLEDILYLLDNQKKNIQKEIIAKKEILLKTNNEIERLNDNLEQLENLKDSLNS